MALKKKYKILRSGIIDLLTQKGIIETVDNDLIDQLVFNYQLLHEVQKDLLKGEYMANVRSSDSDPLFQVTPTYSVYKDCLKNILAISRVLALTPSDRVKLKMISEKEVSDGFDN
jgi:P27 family predicted phage terminase small subunit